MHAVNPKYFTGTSNHFHVFSLSAALSLSISPSFSLSLCFSLKFRLPFRLYPSSQSRFSSLACSLFIHVCPFPFRINSAENHLQRSEYFPIWNFAYNTNQAAPSKFFVKNSIAVATVWTVLHCDKSKKMTAGLHGSGVYTDVWVYALTYQVNTLKFSP